MQCPKCGCKKICLIRSFKAIEVVFVADMKIQYHEWDRISEDGYDSHVECADCEFVITNLEEKDGKIVPIDGA